MVLLNAIRWNHLSEKWTRRGVVVRRGWSHKRARSETLVSPHLTLSMENMSRYLADASAAQFSFPGQAVLPTVQSENRYMPYPYIWYCRI
jgi:hypothetical protein